MGGVLTRPLSGRGNNVPLVITFQEPEIRLIQAKPENLHPTIISGFIIREETYYIVLHRTI